MGILIKKNPTQISLRSFLLGDVFKINVNMHMYSSCHFEVLDKT